ncbi:MAG: hypothetical protein RL557_29 [archaeon]|jgi:hypothetical protein
MAKKNSASVAALVNLAVWLTGVIVSLSVGFAMTNGTLSLPRLLGGMMVAEVAGWVVIILTLLSVVLAIVEKLR